MSSILLLDRDGRHLRHGAGPSLPASYSRAIDGMAIGPGEGSCGTAAFTNQPVVVPDIDVDPRWAGFRKLAQEHGLRACWSVPICSSAGSVLGTFALYYREVRRPSAEERRMVRLLSSTAALVLDREREAEDRRQAELRVRLAAETARLGLWVWDPVEDKVTWENDKTCDIFGFDPSDEPINAARLVSNHIACPQDALEFQRATTATLTMGEPFYFEGKINRKDGGMRWVELRGRLQQLGDTGKVQLLGSCLDVTERRNAEAALRDTRSRLDSTLAAAEIATWTWDIAADRVYPDSNLAKFFSLPDASAAGAEIALYLKAIHPEDKDRVTRLIAQALESKGSYEATYRVKHADGTYRQVIARGRPELDENGQPVRLPGVLIDVTGQKQAEDELRALASQLEAVDRRKNIFLATLAHELRNPLAPIVNGLHIMSLSEGKPATQRKAREMIERQVRTMVRLVDDLLDIARISGGKVTMQKERVDLRSVVASAVETSQPLLDAALHQLTLRLPDEPMFVDADRTRLIQVFSNLLNNAAKYTREGGRIELTACRDGSEAVIAVSDNGIGIEARALRTLFEMFSQVDESAHQTQGGLGVGLALARRLVELHDGSVVAESQGAGKGSTFTVRLPLAGEAKAHGSSAASAATAHGAGAPPVRVLVVDDNKDAADSLALLLEAKGYGVVKANDGLRALDAVQASRPDVAFIDIGMPGMNGCELARALRRLPGMNRVVLAALTGWGTEADRARSKEAGFDHHLTKPASIEAVETVIAQLSKPPLVKASDPTGSPASGASPAH